MSDKKAKHARKFIKNYLKQKEPMDKPKVEYNFGQLQSFVQLSIFLTGKKPEKIELVEGYYNWFIQEAQIQAESLGLNQGFKNDKPTFLGVPLEKKVTIVVPEVVTLKEPIAN